VKPAFRQTIDHIVVNDVGDIRISPDGVDEVISSLAIHATIPALVDDDQLGLAALMAVATARIVRAVH